MDTAELIVTFGGIALIALDPVVLLRQAVLRATPGRPCRRLRLPDAPVDYQPHGGE